MRRGAPRYLGEKKLWRGVNAAFEVALSDLAPQSQDCDNEPTPLICVDSPGTKFQEGGLHTPNKHQLTLSFIDPLTRGLDRSTISRTFLRRSDPHQIQKNWGRNMRRRRRAIGLRPVAERDCIFIPFQLDDQLSHSSPHLGQARRAKTYDTNDIESLRSSDPQILQAIRKFVALWLKTNVEDRKCLGRDIGVLSRSFNIKAANYLFKQDKAVLVEALGKKGRGQFTIARSLTDLKTNNGRFTGIARNPFAFLNAAQLSLTIRGMDIDIFEDLKRIC